MSANRERFLFNLNIDFSVHGTEWLTLFSEAVSEQSSAWSVVGWSYSSNDPQLKVDIGVDSGCAVIEVLVAHSERPVRVVADEGPNLDESSVEMISNAIRIAESRVGKSNKEFEWSAVLLQRPGPRGVAERLDRPFSIGRNRLAPLDFVFRDPYPVNRHDSLHSYGVHQSIPVRVVGRSPGYSWREDASKNAARTLRDICAILAVSWEFHTYEVVEAAAPIDCGIRQARECRPWLRGAQFFRNGEVDWASHSINDWYDVAIEKVNHEQKLRYAVDAFLEARYVEDLHPSLAVVAYTASIEVVAGMLFKAQRCAACGSHMEIARRFRAALREVLSEGAAASLERMYNSRSRTVHDGRLHGRETTPGYWGFSVFPDDVSGTFSWEVMHLATAARLLLLRALTGGLPPQRVLSTSLRQP